MGLIAREIEAAGIPTLSMSSARDITRAVNPPRSVYIDFPLGHTSGRPNDPALGTAIMSDTLAAFERLNEPGSMSHLRYRWEQTDAWKEAVFNPLATGSAGDPTDGTGGTYEDDRTERFDTPQYQSTEDQQAAALAHEGQGCLVCAGIDY